uniref:Uncharacterized protein n=1 Tax=Sphenodon punctatus TaxID=8508 RepID=A0A8D0HQC9_SPHPU
MHNFLFREEEAEQALLAKLSLQVTVSLTPMLQTLTMGMKFAPAGELYAKVPTPYALTLDSDEGYLLSRSVSMALLAPHPPADKRVYEVQVESKASSERCVWLLLPQRCCFELGLQSGTPCKMEIQFQ